MQKALLYPAEVVQPLGTASLLDASSGLHWRDEGLHYACVCIYSLPHAHCKDSLLACCAPLTALLQSAQPHIGQVHKRCHFRQLKPPGCPQQHITEDSWLWCHHVVINSSIL